MTRHFLVTRGCLPAVVPAAQAGPSTWTPSTGLDTQHARAFGSHNGVIYAGTEGDGIFSSTSGALSFTPLSGGLTAPGATSIRALDSIGGTLFAGTTAGLFKLAGSAWQPVGQAPDCPGGTNCAAIEDATDDQYVLKAGDQGDQVKVRVTARGPFPQSPTCSRRPTSTTA